MVDKHSLNLKPWSARALHTGGGGGSGDGFGDDLVTEN
jgi:hypothetical protein